MSLFNYLIKLVEWNHDLDRRLRLIEENDLLIERVLNQILEDQKKSLSNEQKQLAILQIIRDAVAEPLVATFHIHQQGVFMTPKKAAAPAGIILGQTGHFTATPLDSNGNPIALPTGFTLGAWVSSDPANTPSPVVSADGLSIDVTVLATDPNSTFNLSLSGTNPDGSPASGNVDVPVLPVPPPPPPPQPNVVSFSISQS